MIAIMGPLILLTPAVVAVAAAVVAVAAAAPTPDQRPAQTRALCAVLAIVVRPLVLLGLHLPIT